MKSVFAFIVLLASSVLSLHAQTIRVVNNNPGAPTGANVYATVPAAIAAASSGDVLHIVPSPLNYGDFTIDKSLKIYGIGFNPDKDLRQLSHVGFILISGDLNGIAIEGLSIRQISFQTGNISNTTIKNNRVASIVEAGRVAFHLQNLLVQNNVINTEISLPVDMRSNGVVVTNNIFPVRSILSGGNGIIVSQNLFMGEGDLAFHTLNDAVVNNNIFYGKAPRGNTINNSSFQHNLVFGNVSNDFFVGPLYTNTASGNVIGVDPQFVGLTITQGAGEWDFNYDATLASGSPAIGAGTNGADIGILGGATPFDLTGVPLPLLQTLTIPAVIGSDQDLNVTIRARGTRNN